jgi:hypothetical protein
MAGSASIASTSTSPIVVEHKAVHQNGRQIDRPGQHGETHGLQARKHEKPIELGAVPARASAPAARIRDLLTAKPLVHGRLDVPLALAGGQTAEDHPRG